MNKDWEFWLEKDDGRDEVVFYAKKEVGDAVLRVRLEGNGQVDRTLIDSFFLIIYAEEED